MNEDSTYKRAGVDLQAGLEATTLMSAAIKATYGPQVLSDVGAFGGLFAVSHLKEMNAPVLVASTDGVGTKTKVAARVGRWDTIGQDIVNHCLNDILVQGARPLFMLDYLASAKLAPRQIAAVVAGVAHACKKNGIALLGGETAEMPGVYQPGELDLVGTIIGVVERKKIIDGSRIEVGDAILGLPSSGLHTNGYSLARKALDRLDWTQPLAELGNVTIGDALLSAHRSYFKQVFTWLEGGVDISGLAHITGGGLIDNPIRILPKHFDSILKLDAWVVPPIFKLIQQQGEVSDAEMAHVFNLGLGMLIFLPSTQVDDAQRLIPEAVQVGEVQIGTGSVRFK